MQEAVSAILPHVSSSASNVMHEKCPEGEDSWCGFKKDPQSYKHGKGLPVAVMEVIQPVFNDLANPDLLKKCLHGKTQNNNECLNKIVWDRCNKEYYVEKEVIEEAVYSAVSHFNDGRSSLISLFEAMNIVPGIFTSYSCQRQDSQRITGSLTKSSTPAKKGESC